MRSLYQHRWVKMWWWVGVWLGVAVLVLLGSGGAMRESDQASIITGALDLAWGGEVFGNEAYRYDKFFGSYWLLALWYKLWGASVGDDAVRVVGLGNAFAALVYVLGMGVALWRVKFDMYTGMVAWVAVSAPVLVLSAPLFSPNVLSVGCLCLLIGLLRRKRLGIWSALGVVGCTFLAVGCRMDAVLVMPALCWLCERREWYKLWKSGRCVCLFVGSLLALLMGRVVGLAHVGGIGESFFFEPLIAAGYLVFGLWMSLLVLMIFFM